MDSRRIEKSISRFSYRFLNRIFTEAERNAAATANRPGFYFAKRFAAKEAVYKALSGSGLPNLGWQQAEILSRKNGAPQIRLNGRCKTALEAITPDGYKSHVLISISDEPPYAVAFVVISAAPVKTDS